VGLPFTTDLQCVLQVGWAICTDKSTAAIDREVLQTSSSGRRPKPKKKTMVCSSDGLVIYSVKSCTCHCTLHQASQGIHLLHFQKHLGTLYTSNIALAYAFPFVTCILVVNCLSAGRALNHLSKPDVLLPSTTTCPVVMSREVLISATDCLQNRHAVM